MEHVSDCLKKFLRATRLEKPVSQYTLVLDWPEVVGKEIASHSEALDLRDGILWVAVPSSNWRQHILFLKPQILKTFQGRFPKISIRDIRCVTSVRRSEEQNRTRSNQQDEV